MPGTVEENPPETPAARTVADASLDFSAQLLDMLKLTLPASQTVRVKRISAHYYRVNYLTQVLAGADISLKTYQIVRSQFLFVDSINGELHTTDKTRR